MINIDHITKNYGAIRALDSLTLVIKQGEVFGLLGPNGAGKTTTIKILTTLSKPTSGRAAIGGHDVKKEPLAVKNIIGVAPQEINLDKELTAEQNLRVYGMLHRLDNLGRNIKDILELAGLSERSNHLVRDFSGGMQRRLLIARALLTRPKVLFLDEPTVGLDPQVRRQIWDLVRNLKENGTTVFLTTHYIEEAEALCTRVGILSRGRLIALGTPQELKGEVGGFVLEYQENGNTRYILCRSREEAHSLSQSKKGPIIIRESNLEDVFIKLTGERIGTAEQ
ncbi:MAG: ATP-binding cassette domain-containing protein [Deltaproteobacteria bacterium]|nr:ATP-binding cassette domain-containing protein [Deltaproteobacteria bacterium]